MRAELDGGGVDGTATTAAVPGARRHRRKGRRGSDGSVEVGDQQHAEHDDGGDNSTNDGDAHPEPSFPNVVSGLSGRQLVFNVTYRETFFV